MSFSTTGTPHRAWSPRPDTPEIGVSQGRRSSTRGVQLLDEDGGDITPQFESALSLIFAKYCTPRPAARNTAPSTDAVMDAEALDQWARDTNGSPFSEETIEEMKEYLDTDDAGNLTWKGFLQIYALQTENDEEETWRDLSSHGFDRSLQLVSARREDIEVDEGTPVPMSQLRGVGLGGELTDTRYSTRGSVKATNSALETSAIGPREAFESGDHVMQS